MENFNNQFRQKSFQNMPIRFEDAIVPLNIYGDYLYEMFMFPKTQEEFVYKNLALSTICLDTYKIYNYRLCARHLTDKEKMSFDRIKEYINNNSFEEILSDKSFFKKCLLQSYRFYQLPLIEKMLAFKYLSTEQHRKLEKMLPNHILDKEEYDVQLNKELFLNSIKDILKKYNSGVIRYIADYIKIASNLSDEFIDPILKEIVKSDYKMSDYYTYSLSKDVNEQLRVDLKQILDVLRNSDYEDYKRLYMTNDIALTDAIQSYLILNTEYKDPDKEEIIDYVNSNNYDSIFDFDNKVKVKEKNEL